MLGKAVTGSSEVFAIYGDSLEDPLGIELQLKFCMWADGQIVWSKKENGKSRYYRSESGTRLFEVLSRLQKLGLFSLNLEATSHVGVGFGSDTIYIKYEQRVLRLVSCHQRLELTENVAAISTGGRILDGELRYPVLSREPQSFLFFRFLWLELEMLAIQNLPSSGSPCNGKLRFYDEDHVEWVFDEGA